VSFYPDSPAEKHRREAERHLTLARWYSRGPGAATRTEQNRRDAEAAKALVAAFMATPNLVVLPVDETGARRLAEAIWGPQSSYILGTSYYEDARAVLDRLAGREPEPEIRSEDCIREAIRADAQPVHEGDRGVRITHRPSGITVESTSERSQLQNTAAAIRELQRRLAEGGER
jgi:hypothetical protein